MLYRYSTNDFKPKHQQHLEGHADFMLNLEYYIQDYTDIFLKNTIREGKVLPDGDFDYFGCFVFLTIPDEECKRFMLNHLDAEKKQNLHLFKAQANDNIIVYVDNGFVFDPKNKTTLGQAIDKQESSIYIPSCSIEYIHSIQNLDKLVFKNRLKL